MQLCFVFFICSAVSFLWIEYAQNSTAKSLKEHMETISRLYETQWVYDKRLEVNQFLNAQYELRNNKEKPSIARKSERLLSQKDYLPIYKRVDDVLEKSKNDKEKLKEKVLKEQQEKLQLEMEEIERNRVDRKTKDKKTDIHRWNQVYDERFHKYLDRKLFIAKC